MATSRSSKARAASARGTGDFEEIFATLRGLLGRYAPPLVRKVDTAKEVHLYSVKDVELAGRKLEELYFAGARLQKGSVGLYFFPIYTHEERFAKLPEPLGKRRTGKSCFQFKKPLDAAVRGQVEALLERGFDLYRRERLVG